MLSLFLKLLSIFTFTMHMGFKDLFKLSKIKGLAWKQY